MRPGKGSLLSGFGSSRYDSAFWVSFAYSGLPVKSDRRVPKRSQLDLAQVRTIWEVGLTLENQRADGRNSVCCSAILVKKKKVSKTKTSPAFSKYFEYWRNVSRENRWLTVVWSFRFRPFHGTPESDSKAYFIASASVCDCSRTFSILSS